LTCKKRILTAFVAVGEAKADGMIATEKGRNRIYVG
jgi:hypothetical protein